MPLRPGITTSRRTTSGFSRRAARTPSSALPASATTSRSVSRSSSRRRPVRTTAWSSTMSTLIVGVRVTAAATRGRASCRRRASTRRRATRRAARPARACRAGRGRRSVRSAGSNPLPSSSIITDTLHSFVSAGRSRAAPRRASPRSSAPPARCGTRRSRASAGRRLPPRRASTCTSSREASRHRLPETLERGHQTEVVERLRSQLDREPPDVLQGRHHEPAQLRNSRARLLGRTGGFDGCETEQHRRERLTRLVVQLARQPAALELLGRDRAAQRVARDATREVDRDRRAFREALRETHVVVGRTPRPGLPGRGR